MERITERIDALYSGSRAEAELDHDDLKGYGLTDITLRPYQVAGVNWILRCMKNGHGCLLGDEMGLGKTCQTVSVLVALAGRGESCGPHLLLCPLSVINNWKTELKQFAPGLKFMVYVGDKDARADLREDFKKKISKMSVLVTTYEICLKDEYFLRKFSWYCLIVDEAHRLKNRDSLLHQSLLEFDIEHRLLLTGTPVQNNLVELYTLLSFVAPSIFKFRYCNEFVEAYSDVEDKSEASELHKMLQPFLLRRVKSQVLKDLPKRSEVVLFHGLSAIQKKYYKAILTKDIDVFSTGHNAPKTRLMNILMHLRKCVNHPYLFDGVEPEPFQLGEHLVEASGKLELLDQLLTYVKPLKHKVLVFSQMTHMLDIVQDYLGYRGYSYERLDGSVRGEERYLAIKSFNDEASTFIFLLSTKAGGVGLNLTSADTVIFLDSDFNPQNDLQAAARAHRIGQTRPVKVIRLIGRSTVEEITLRRAEAKLKLTETVIEGDQFAHGVEATKAKEDLIVDNNIKLQDILKFGVDKLLENDDSSIEEVDFDTILGPTVDGEWTEVADRQTMESLAAETMQMDNDEDEGGEGDADGNMYKFDGTDYSQQPSTADQEAVKKLIDAQMATVMGEDDEQEEGGRTLRRTKTSLLHGLLPDTLKKPRTPLTPEQIAERNKKRAETLARKAKELKEEEARREEKRIKRRKARWAANNYTSLNLPVVDPEDEENEEEEEQDEEVSDDASNETDSRSINYVTGDVTTPDGGIKGDVIIVHCVDDSGSWGSGGLFSALSRRSTTVEEQYELAGEMRDLNLGDVHLIKLQDRLNRDNSGTEYVALIVAQTRDRQGQLTGIKLSHLAEGLKKLYTKAKACKASVHLPRLGYATPGFNWYGTERLIRKHLTARGIPTYMYPTYYYKRHQQAIKRKQSASPDPTSNDDQNGSPSTSKGKAQPPKKMRKMTNSFADPEAGTSSNNAESLGSQVKVDLTNGLPDFMQGVSVHFVGIPAEMRRTLTRYLIAFDGDVHSDIEDYTTHLVVSETPTEEDKQDTEKITEAYQDVQVVKATWLVKCFFKQQKVDTQQYLHSNV